MNKYTASRRRFLLYVSSISAVLATLPACSKRIEEDQVSISGSSENETLALPSRQKILESLLENLFPLEGLPDTPYQELAEQLFALTESDPVWEDALSQAQHSLDADSGGNWLEADNAVKIATMQAYEQEPWFLTIKFRSQFIFFERSDVWGALGYEGPSLHKGGYINRGFDDIDWLPEVNQ